MRSISILILLAGLTSIGLFLGEPPQPSPTPSPTPTPIAVQSLFEDDTRFPPYINGGLAWSPDGKQLAIGTSKGIWIHDASDLHVLGHFAADLRVTSLDWSSKTDQIVVGSEKGEVELWEANDGTRVMALGGHMEPIESVVWSPDGKWIASSGLDFYIRIWDAQSGALLQAFKPSDYRQIYPLAWSPSSHQLATFVIGVTDSYVTVWDIELGTDTSSWKHNQETYALKWSPNGEILATGGGTSLIYLWDVSTGLLLETLDVGGFATVQSLAWSFDSTRLASTSIVAQEDDNGKPYESYATQIWDLTTDKWKLVSTDALMTGDGWYTNALGWSPDDSYLASISDNGSVFIWDTKTFSVASSFKGYKSVVLKPS